MVSSRHIYDSGGSFGFQIGGQATDFVLLVMNRRSVDGILQGKFKLGADAAISAGPVGRNAQADTDIQLKGGMPKSADGLLKTLNKYPYKK